MPGNKIQDEMLAIAVGQCSEHIGNSVTFPLQVLKCYVKKNPSDGILNYFWGDESKEAIAELYRQYENDLKSHANAIGNIPKFFHSINTYMVGLRNAKKHAAIVEFVSVIISCCPQLQEHIDKLAPEVKNAFYVIDVIDHLIARTIDSMLERMLKHYETGGKIRHIVFSSGVHHQIHGLKLFLYKQAFLAHSDKIKAKIAELANLMGRYSGDSLSYKRILNAVTYMKDGEIPECHSYLRGLFAKHEGNILDTKELKPLSLYNNWNKYSNSKKLLLCIDVVNRISHLLLQDSFTGEIQPLCKILSIIGDRHYRDTLQPIMVNRLPAAASALTIDCLP